MEMRTLAQQTPALAEERKNAQKWPMVAPK